MISKYIATALVSNRANDRRGIGPDRNHEQGRHCRNQRDA